MVETVARMNEQQRETICKNYGRKWSYKRTDTNAIDQEMYDKKHYG